MANRPTLKDVAVAAGVGTATVDRVLNKRGNVREATARRILKAARLVGYHACDLFEQRFSFFNIYFIFKVDIFIQQHAISVLVFS